MVTPKASNSTIFLIFHIMRLPCHPLRGSEWQSLQSATQVHAQDWSIWCASLGPGTSHTLHGRDFTASRCARSDLLYFPFTSLCSLLDIRTQNHRACTVLFLLLSLRLHMIYNRTAPFPCRIFLFRLWHGRNHGISQHFFFCCGRKQAFLLLNVFVLKTLCSHFQIDLGLFEIAILQFYSDGLAAH
jgi:hypothetical protein